MSATTTVTVRISPRLKKRLNKLADATSRSRSSLAADALRVYVEEEERHLAAIREGVKDVEDGRVVSHARVSRWMRSWGKKRELPPPACE